jgi:hypothetical protein
MSMSVKKESTKKRKLGNSGIKCKKEEAKSQVLQANLNRSIYETPRKSSHRNSNSSDKKRHKKSPSPRVIGKSLP